jgi:hypothetical protein
MEGNKSFLMYIFVFIFIGLIMVFYVIPNSKEEVLSCTLLTNETGIITIYRVESVYQHNKFQYVNIDMELDINRYWIKKNDYIYSLEKDSSAWTDVGFDFNVEEDRNNKKVIAHMYGDYDTLNKDLIYFNDIEDVQEHFEGMEYKCKIGGLE